MFPVPQRNELGYISEEWANQMVGAAKECNSDKAGLRQWRREQEQENKEND